MIDTNLADAATSAKSILFGDDLPIEGVTLEDLERHLSDFYSSDDVTSATYNRNVATITSLFTWATHRSWAAASPAIALERRTQRRTRQQEAQGRVIAPAQLAAWIADPAVALRERLLWQSLYDTAARARRRASTSTSKTSTCPTAPQS